MKIDATLFPISPPLPLQLPDRQPVCLVAASLTTPPVDLIKAVPETLLLQQVGLVVVLPVVLEKTGYRHGGIND